MTAFAIGIGLGASAMLAGGALTVLACVALMSGLAVAAALAFASPPAVGLSFAIAMVGFNAGLVAGFVGKATSSGVRSNNI